MGATDSARLICSVVYTAQSIYIYTTYPLTLYTASIALHYFDSLNWELLKCTKLNRAKNSTFMQIICMPGMEIKTDLNHDVLTNLYKSLVLHILKKYQKPMVKPLYKWSRGGWILWILVVHTIHERSQVSKCQQDFTITMPGSVAVILHAVQLF